MKYYKLAKPNGWDFQTGNTVNYRENIGKTVQVPTRKTVKAKYELCSADVLHACPNPNDCFVGAKIPCSVYVVSGKPVVDDTKKFGFRVLKILEEIAHEKLDNLFGWKYGEAANPINPFKIKPPQIGEEQIKLLQNWVSVWDSVLASVWASVRASVWDSVRDLVWDSVGDSVGDSVRVSVRVSVGASVGDSVWAYIGSLFPKIKTWKYVKCEDGKYPFQPAVDLWKQGLVPSFDGNVWRLHGGEKADIFYSMNKKEVN